MAYIKFKDRQAPIQGTVTIISENLIRIETPTEPDISGFSLFIDKAMNMPMSKKQFGTFTTLYNRGEGWYELSNDGSVYVEPTPVVRFDIGQGATTVDGELEQEARDYEDLVIPNVIAEEGYEFKGWEPEVPSEGEIEGDVVFRAIIVDKNVYFHVSGGGSLQGETKQAVYNYNELKVPEVIADENYEFVGWMPEIPSEGEVDIANTHFYAVFESSIPSRLETLENDLTDTQMGLVENYDATLATAEEVTNLQLALVEVYELFLGGM